MSITAVRTLPGPTSPLWDDPQTVADIAGVALPATSYPTDPDTTSQPEWGALVLTALTELGSTREAVAGRLVKDGIVGRQRDPRRNPIARWLQPAVGGPDDEVAGIRVREVTGARVLADVLDWRGNWAPLIVTTERVPAVAAFLATFDAGPANRCAWPALLDRSDIAVSAVAA